MSLHRPAFDALYGCSVHHVQKLRKQIVAVMWTSRCFRVILNTKGRMNLMANAFDGLVVEIHMSDLDVRRQSGCIDCKTMIL